MNRPANQPELAQLLSRYLEQQAEAPASGAASEVVPYESVSARTVDPRLAWSGALAAGRHFTPALPAASMPSDWPGMVPATEAVNAVAFALGNFPQLVSNLPALLTAKSLASLRPTGSPASSAPGESAKSSADPLLAAGVLRLAGQVDAARELLRSARNRGASAVLANEEAALRWHAGEHEAALAAWQAQADSVPVDFNRGMALLFLDRPAEARPFLTRAAAALSEDDPWHHLAHLYLALAEMRA